MNRQQTRRYCKSISVCTSLIENTTENCIYDNIYKLLAFGIVKTAREIKNAKLHTQDGDRGSPRPELNPKIVKSV